MCSVNTTGCHPLNYNVEGSDLKAFSKAFPETATKVPSICRFNSSSVLGFLPCNSPLIHFADAILLVLDAQPPTSNMFVKSLTNRKSKLWWCSVVHKVRSREAAIYYNVLIFIHPVGHYTRKYFPKLLGKKYISMQIEN